MANTTNFGWETPDDTDLVKDGAAAIRTLGSAIDTSLVDLKGGTTGQVLAKASNTDMDFTWSSDQVGIPASTVDAKGDLIAGTANDTVSRLAVGTNNQFLQADSSTATGLKWADGAQYTLISSTSLTANNQITISSIPATYKDLRLVIEGVQPNATANLSMNFNGTVNGSIYTMGWYINSAPTNATLQAWSNGSQGLRLYGTSVRSGNGNSIFTVNVYNYADATVYKTGDYRGMYLQGSNHLEFLGGFFGAEFTAAISSINLSWTNGTSTFSAGTALLYGVS